MSRALKQQAQAARLVQSFCATSPKILPAASGTRNLSISGPREANPTHGSFESAVASIPKRSDIAPSGRTYNTSRTMKQVNDSSTVDFAYIPASSVQYTAGVDYSRMPILPDNYMVKHPEIAPEPHVPKAEISTTALSDAVATMSEAETSKAADGMGLHEKKPAEQGIVGRIWNDVLDDVFGAKKPSSAANA